jgi:hypothetical protein
LLAGRYFLPETAKAPLYRGVSEGLHNGSVQLIKNIFRSTFRCPH